MAQEVDRNKVFQTTRVRTALKNDFSWIQRPKQENKEQDNTRMDQAVGTRPAPVRQNSYVLVTAKKFESVDPTLNPQFTPSKGDSADQPNGEVISPQEDAQPKGSTVETIDDTKFQAVTEKLIPNAEAQPQNSEIVSPVEPAEQPVSSTTTENNQQNTNTVAEVAIAHKTEVAEVSTDVHAEGCVQNGEAQPVSSAEVNLDDVAPVQPAEPPAADTAAEIKDEHVGTTIDQANIEQNEVKVSEDAHVDGTVAETPVLADSVESTDSTEVVAAVNALPDNVDPVPDLLPKSELPTQPSVETTTEGSCEKSHSLESIEAVAEVKVDSSPETPAVLDIAGDDATPQASVEPVPDIVANPVSDSPPQPAAETATEQGPPGETVETAAEVKVESTPATPAVTDAAEQTATQTSVEPVPDVVANAAPESSSQLAADIATEKGPSVDSVEAVADVKTESLPVTPVVADTAGEQIATQTSVEPVTDTVASPVSESPSQSAVDAIIERGSSVGSGEAVAEVKVEASPAMLALSDTPGEVAPQASVEPESPSQPAAETAPEKGPSVETAQAVAEVKLEASPPEQGAAETVEAEAEVKVESAIPARTDLAGEQAVPQANVEPVPDLVADTVPESSTQPAEAEVMSVEIEVVSATPAVPVSQTRTEEVVECEVQPVDSTAAEQSVQPTSEGVQEFNIKDVAGLITPSDANSHHKAIDLMDALDVTLPTSEAAPEPPKDPDQSQTEETKLDQQSDQINTSEVSETPVMEQQSTQTRKTRDGKSVCAFCDQIIVGRIKLIFSEPLIDCHPDCLKCGMCAKALGDLLTPMFLRDQVIQCDVCFEKTRKT